MRKLNLPLLIGIILILIVIIPILIGLFYTPYDPTLMEIPNRFQSPVLEHWFGTDQYGRDLLSRVMVGGRTSLLIASVAVSSGLVIGVSLGALSGYYGRWLDEVLMRTAEIIYAFPSVLLALLAVAIFGPGRNTVMLAITIGNVPVFMKITRASFLKQKKNQYVQAAKAIGASNFRVMLRHILPNSFRLIFVQASSNFANAILAEASLSYIGVGVQPPHPSWGRMLREAQSFGGLAPWTVIFPGIAIALIVLGLNLFSDGLKQKGT